MVPHQNLGFFIRHSVPGSVQMVNFVLTKPEIIWINFRLHSQERRKVKKGEGASSHLVGIILAGIIFLIQFRHGDYARQNKSEKMSNCMPTDYGGHTTYS